MRFGPHHLALLLALAACQPSWDSKVPVGQGVPGGPLHVLRPATVTVYAGDTVYSIARRYSLSVRELIEANNLQPPYALAAGTVLRLPGGGADYVVQKGDTLSVLARRFKVDFNTFAATNNKRPPYVLHVGERLTIPGAKSPTGPGSAQTVASAPIGERAGKSGDRSSSSSQPPSYVTHPNSPKAPASPVAEPPARGGATFLWPVKGEIVMEFGPMASKGQHNDGINIAAPKGAPVKAAENGTVAYVGNELKGFGNLLLIKHSDGFITAYAHNEKMMVKRGDVVRRGQTIATVGQSGSATSPQLHFEIRRGAEAVNPAEYLRDGAA